MKKSTIIISDDNTFFVKGLVLRNYTKIRDEIIINSNFLFSNEKTAYGYNVNPYPEGPVIFHLDMPGNITVFDYLHYPLLSGLTWMNDWRLIGCDYSSGYIYDINPLDCLPCCIGGGGVGLLGLAFDPVSKRMYGSGHDGYLYEINPVNGEQSQIGPFGSGYIIMTGLAFDNAGVLFGWDVIKDSLWTIDTTTGAATIVGPLGINLCYLQDGDFYREDNVLYLAAYFRKPSFGYYPYSCLFTCDTKTGNCTFAGQIEENYQLSALGIPYGWDIPYVDFTWTPVLPAPEKDILFNASKSYDPDGHITIYEWDWDNDGVFDESHEDPFAEHSWDETGKYPVILRVTDNASLNMSKTIKVLVDRPPYKPKIFGPRFVEKRFRYNYTIKGRDPDSDNLSEFYIDWGDGCGSSRQGSFPSGTEIDFDHFWTENGTYYVKATVEDIYEVSSCTTIKVYIPRNAVANIQWYSFFSDRFPILAKLFSFFDRIYI